MSPLEGVLVKIVIDVICIAVGQWEADRYWEVYKYKQEGHTINLE